MSERKTGTARATIRVKLQKQNKKQIHQIPLKLELGGLLRRPLPV